MTPIYASGETNVLGINLPSKIILKTSKDTLIRNGYAIAKLFEQPGYVGVLYTQEYKRDPQIVLLSNESAAMYFYFVQDDLSPDYIHRWFIETVLLNNPTFSNQSDEQKLKDLADKIKAPYNAGDVLAFIYTPQNGLTISRNNIQIAQWPYGKSFFNVLLRMWLGEFPPSRGFKKGVLGRAA